MSATNTSGTRVEAVTVQLRDMILCGKLRAGQRVPEVELASTLGVSRTPVRLALGILEAEGLLDGVANRGFRVRSFTADDVLSSFDVRGVLEGLACRVLAERGLSETEQQELQDCLAVGADLAGGDRFSEPEMRRWAVANDHYHRTLVDAANLPALSDVYKHLSRLPLASPVAILFRGDRPEQAARLIRQSHIEHEQIFKALLQGESARAEWLIKEHAYQSKKNVQLELSHDRSGDNGAQDTLPLQKYIGREIG